MDTPNDSPNRLYRRRQGRMLFVDAIILPEEPVSA